MYSARLVDELPSRLQAHYKSSTGTQPNSFYLTTSEMTLTRFLEAIRAFERSLPPANTTPKAAEEH